MNTQQSQAASAVTLASVRRVQRSFIRTTAGRHVTTRRLYRAITDMFIQYLCGMRSGSADRITLNTDNLLCWMIRDCQSRTASYAGRRLGILGQYLRAIHLAGLTATDLMGDFRAAHRQPYWTTLAKALQSPDSAAELISLQSPPPVGPLHRHVQQYLEIHESLGKRYRSQRVALFDLDRHLRTWDICSPKAVDATTIQRWIGTLTCTPRVRIHKTRIVRNFFDYLMSLQVLTQNPLGPARFIEARPDPITFQPFIFNQQQIASLLAYVRNLPSNHAFPLRGPTCHLMIAMLYALGLRHGEALRLRIGDIDFDRQTLQITNTKFHKSRLIPFGPKLGLRLRRYMGQRRRLFGICHEDDPLFVAYRRKRMSYGTLMSIFRAALRTMEVSGTNGSRLPRLHDLRHSFAVHRLLRWYKEGVDVQNRLPVLATFMGHVNVVSTQVYLTITFELLHEANVRFHRHFGSQFDAEVQP